MRTKCGKRLAIQGLHLMVRRDSLRLGLPSESEKRQGDQTGDQEMARMKNLNPTTRISISVTDQLGAYLDALARKGLHGATASEVAKRFVQNGIIEAIRSGDLALPDLTAVFQDEAA